MISNCFDKLTDWTFEKVVPNDLDPTWKYVGKVAILVVLSPLILTICLIFAICIGIEECYPKPSHPKDPQLEPSHPKGPQPELMLPDFRSVRDHILNNPSNENLYLDGFKNQRDYDDTFLESIENNCKNKKIIEIEWSYCNFSAKKIIEFIQKQGTKLKVISFIDCPGVTDEVLSAISKHCSDLQELNLRDNTSITESSLNQLHSKFPKLKLDCSYCKKISSDFLKGIITRRYEPQPMITRSSG